MARYAVKELKKMSVEELIKILVKNSISSKNPSSQLEDVILQILSEREAIEYDRMIRDKKEKEQDG